MSFLSICVAFLLRWRGCLKREDSVPISKLVFNVFYPTLLFGKISKAEFSADLLNVGCASMLVHAFMLLAVIPLSRFAPVHNGFRGQWMINMLGCNIGFTYPLILSAGDIGKGVFPALVTWDLMGNSFLILLANAVVALAYSPLQQDEDGPTPDEADGRLTDAAGTPTAYGRRCVALAQAAPQAGIVPTGVGGYDFAADDNPESPSTEAGNALGGLQAAAAIDESEAPGMQAMSLSSTLSLGRLHGSFLLALSGGSRKSPDRPRVAGKHRAPFFRKVLVTAATNVPLLAILAGLLVSCSGWRFSPGTDGVLEGMGEPFGCLFFVVVGLNLSLSSVQRAWRQLCLIIGGRTALHATMLGFIWATGVIPERHSRQAITLALCCPVPGLTMAYVLDFGYDRSLQASLTGITNLISLVLLYTILFISREG